MSVLTLASRQRTGRDQRYFDFVIDGVSLYDALQPGDMVSCLGWSNRDVEDRMAARLLLDMSPALETGRIELYICGECGDIGCGAITALVELIPGDRIRWSAFGYENNYDPSLPDTQRYAAIGPFTFDRGAYRKTIESRWSCPGPN